MSVNGVSTRKILWALARREHVLATDRTVVLVFILEAIVGMENIDRDAHAAFGAMAKRFGTANAAKPTFITMEGFL